MALAVTRVILRCEEAQETQALGNVELYIFHSNIKSQVVLKALQKLNNIPY